MKTATYTAYGENNKVIKQGTVEYKPSNDTDTEVMNFVEAVVEDVGEDVFEEQVVGIKG